MLKYVLPLAKKGVPYTFAVPIASIPIAFEKGGKKWRLQPKEAIIQEAIDLLKATEKEERHIQRLQQWLSEKHNLPKDATAKIWHHSVKQMPKRLDKLSPDLVQDLRNPTVNRIVSESRRLANDLLALYGPPATIHVECNRALKGKKQREALEKKRKDNERMNKEAKKQVAEAGAPVTKDNIRKMRLWMETKGICVYSYDKTRTPITKNELFFSASWDIDHIVPASLSHNTSLFNLTLCPAEMNRHGKGKKTPYQFFKNQPERWEKIKAGAKELFSPAKWQYFINEAEPSADFSESQVSDSGYIARVVRDLMQHICPKVYMVKGGLTAVLRGYWGLNHILSPKLKSVPGMEENIYYYVRLDEEEKNIIAYKKDPLVAKAADDDYKAWQKVRQDEQKATKKELQKQEKGRVLYGAVRGTYFYPEKNREDYRHNQIDAIVVAFAKNSYSMFYPKAP